MAMCSIYVFYYNFSIKCLPVKIFLNCHHCLHTKSHLIFSKLFKNTLHNVNFLVRNKRQNKRCTKFIMILFMNTFNLYEILVCFGKILSHQEPTLLLPYMTCNEVPYSGGSYLPKVLTPFQNLSFYQNYQ